MRADVLRTEEYREAMNVSKEIQQLKTASLTARVLEKSSQLERAALSRIAMAHICVAQVSIGPSRRIPTAAYSLATNLCVNTSPLRGFPSLLPSG
jgi:hypothetical protein